MRLKKCIVCGKLFQGRPDQTKCEDCIAIARATTLRPRVCRQCGSTFDGGPRAWYCPTCRAERQRVRNAAQRKTGARRPLGSIDKCVVCGKEYVVEAGLQKYCKDCAPEAIRAIDRETARQHYKEDKATRQRHNAEWYSAHREEILARKKYSALTEEQREQQREYQREYKRAMRARKRSENKND